MAVLAIKAGTETGIGSKALSVNFLGAGEYVTVSGAHEIQVWIDDGSAGTVKFSFDAGSTFSADRDLVAGEVVKLRPRPRSSITFDMKADAGTPNVGILAT